MSREAMIAIADTYLRHGLLERKPDAVLLADDCVRIEMGVETGGNATQIRALLGEHVPNAPNANKAIHDLRWVVETPFVDALYSLELYGVDQPVRIATRFEIVDERIRHIEILFNAGALQPVIVEAIRALRTDVPG